MNPAPTTSDTELGITNIIERDVITDTMISTFTTLADKLKSHCGPFSGTAILTDPDAPYQDPVFTKDGINIVKSMSYASPIQDFVRKQLAYIGARIESKAGDGTTSGMIIAAYALSSMLVSLRNNDMVVTNQNLVDAWKKLTTDIKGKYAILRKEQENLSQDDIYHLAYSQALTSSHGDRELAEAIGKLFASTSRLLWENLVLQTANYETDKTYTTDVYTAEYLMSDVVPVRRDILDSENEYHRPAALTVIGSLSVADVNQKSFFTKLVNIAEAARLMKQIAVNQDNPAFVQPEIDPNDKDLASRDIVLIVPNSIDRSTIGWFNEFFANNPDCKITIFTVRSEDKKFDDITALQVLIGSVKDYQNRTGNKSMMTAPSVVDRAIGPMLAFELGLAYSRSMLRIVSGIGIKSEIGVSTIYLHRKDYPLYDSYLKQLTRAIEKEKEDTVTRNDTALRSFQKLFNKLVSTQFVILTIGGSSYDNAAHRDVAQDALKGTVSTMIHGAVFGRCLTLRRVLAELREAHTLLPHSPVTKDSFTESGVRYKLYEIFIDALLKGIQEVDNALAASFKSSILVARFCELKDTPLDITKIPDRDYTPPKDLRDKSQDLILQPMATDLEFLDRFGEVGLKFLTTERVIMDGYLYANKEGDNNK